MTRLLIRSDRLVSRSDGHPASFISGIAQTPPQARARLTAHRAGAARLADRDLQALWASKLPLHGRTGSRSEAIWSCFEKMESTLLKQEDLHAQVTEPFY